jgi:hypothetical protein
MQNDIVPSNEEMRVADFLAEIVHQNKQMMEQFETMQYVYSLHTDDSDVAQALSDIAVELAVQREVFMHRVVQNALWQAATLECLEQRLVRLEARTGLSSDDDADDTFE